MWEISEKLDKSFESFKNLKEFILKPFSVIDNIKESVTKKRNQVSHARSEFNILDSKTWKNIFNIFGNTQSGLAKVEKDITIESTKKEVHEVEKDVKWATYDTTESKDFKDINITAFKNSIAAIESKNQYCIVNNWGATDALGKYQFVWKRWWEKIKNFFKTNKISCIPYSKQKLENICHKYNNKKIMNNKWEDLPYIYTFLESWEIQEKFMDYTVTNYHKKDVETLYSKLNKKYWSIITTKDDDKLWLEQMYMIIHFLWVWGGEIKWWYDCITNWRNNLWTKITWNNISLTQYCDAFNQNYKNNSSNVA
jgi:hypothetical protein